MFPQNYSRRAGQQGGGGGIGADPPLQHEGNFESLVELLQEQKRRIVTDPAARFVPFDQHAVEAGALGSLGLGEAANLQIDASG